ncbi:MAG: metallophosphoesterase, partial [Verrucomicrobia bacterium]|nr:metallophosphoesterase [Verrucomicrobiota bacterium]
MRILFLGDVVAEHGRDAVKELMPQLIEEFAP